MLFFFWFAVMAWNLGWNKLVQVSFGKPFCMSNIELNLGSWKTFM